MQLEAADAAGVDQPLGLRDRLGAARRIDAANGDRDVGVLSAANCATCVVGTRTAVPSAVSSTVKTTQPILRER